MLSKCKKHEGREAVRLVENFTRSGAMDVRMPVLTA